MLASPGDVPLRDLERDRRTVYGYLCAEAPDELELAVWRKEIAQFCRGRGLHLVTVFIDRREPPDRVKRPGLAGLLDALSLPDSYAVVTPTVAHLSTDHAALDVLHRSISHTGSRLFVIHDTSRDPKGGRS
ncbi:hypothetical protein ALI22I_07775 [Saccharothrix sp. ALI-22-I]|uniref:hypothetical protein n=1 Tax=Saccharothrix sp. ALI-22-I TaxID=1933778 RepID=UPI00097C5255|nr:hypothetical protein [Saccharothrix sp. ALI-22-I]ONI91753.1 hypothetical protein ALI22I_07775 [Saccharothrix sp. ALI-22-I]